MSPLFSKQLKTQNPKLKTPLETLGTDNLSDAAPLGARPSRPPDKVQPGKSNRISNIQQGTPNIHRIPWILDVPFNPSSRRQEIIWKSGKQEGNGPCLLSFPDVPDFLIQPIWSSFDFDSDFPLSQLKTQNLCPLSYPLFSRPRCFIPRSV